jgi:hypothetical protein
MAVTKLPSFMTRLLRSSMPLIIGGFTLTACQHAEDPKVKAVTDGVMKTYQEAKKDIASFTPQVQSMTTEEIEKLFAFEYNVIDIPERANRESIALTLQGLGKERWEVIQIIPQLDGSLRVFVKRRPQSYLRYIPRFFP